MYIYSHKQGSAGAKALAKAMGAKRIRHENSKFRGRPNKTVINWGCSALPPEIMKCNVINMPDEVNLCSNKLSYLRLRNHYQGFVRLPNWTVVKKHAVSWDCVVVARHVLVGSGGVGIEIVEAGQPMPDAPLYTKYIKKESEWRVHVADGKVICCQKKARKHDVPDDDVDWRVRNLAGGFIYATGLGMPNPDVTHQAMLAMGVTRLDFGAVDVIWNEYEQKAYVLEINTAPGLQGKTVEAYANWLKEREE